MKQRIHIHDEITGKDIVGTIEIPAKDHLEAQKRHKAIIFRPKRGKGSFTRKRKHKNKEEE